MFLVISPYTDAMQCQLHIRHGQHRLALLTRYIAQDYGRSLIVGKLFATLLVTCLCHLLWSLSCITFVCLVYQYDW